MKYVISDIHGCFDTFMSLLKKAKFDENKDTLYILGDIVDRGPKIWETYEWVRERFGKSVYMICGNHENDLMMQLFALKGRQRKESPQEETNKVIKSFLEKMSGFGDYDIFEQMRKMAIFDQYGTIRSLMTKHSLDELTEMAIFFFTLQSYMEVDGFTLVHANCMKEIKDTPEEYFYWDRSLALSDSFVEGRKVIYGHTPTTYYTKAAKADDKTREDGSRKINIDCGCAYGGRLCLFRIDDEKYFYQTNIEITRSDE